MEAAFLLNPTPYNNKVVIYNIIAAVVFFHF